MSSEAAINEAAINALVGLLRDADALPPAARREFLREGLDELHEAYPILLGPDGTALIAEARRRHEQVVEEALTPEEAATLQSLVANGGSIPSGDFPLWDEGLFDRALVEFTRGNRIRITPKGEIALRAAR